MAIFRKPKHPMIKVFKKKDIPDGIWLKCEDCRKIIFRKVVEENLKVCPKCNYHFTLTTEERIGLLLDDGSFNSIDDSLKPIDPLQFNGPIPYKQKLQNEQKETGLFDAVTIGIGEIGSIKVAFGITDSRFMMGSMGSVVGEKITRIVEKAAVEILPLIIISGSGGGARMQEGMFSLMQMAKTSASLSYFHQKNLLYISVLTNPTMAGIMASFASLGDIIITEPKALIGFTGPRVIEQTLKQKLPEGFQRSEFLLEHGLIDMIVHRKHLKDTLVKLLSHLG